MNENDDTLPHALNAAELKLASDAIAIGERIAEARERAGITQKQLAESVGMSLVSIKKMSAGEGTIQWAKLVRLANALGVTPNDLLLGSPSTAPETGVRSALEGSYHCLGLSEAEASELAQIVLEVATEPLASAEPEDRPRFRRAISESSVRRFLRAKREK